MLHFVERYVMQRMREIRKEKNMTQAQVAKNMGVSAAMYSQWETGKRIPRLSTISRIADGIGCSVYDLFNETGGTNKWHLKDM